MKKFKFTNDSVLKNALPPGPDDVYTSGNNKGKQKTQLIYSDTEQPGFYVLVGKIPQGGGEPKRTFVAQSKVGGRSRRITIGSFPTFTPAQARKEARSLIVQMAQGTDPNAEKRAQAHKGITLEQAWGLYEETLNNKGRSSVTIKGYQYLIDTYLSDWKQKPLAEITRQAVRKRHKAIAQGVAKGKYAKEIPTRAGNVYTKKPTSNGHYAANATMRAFRAIYNRALKQHEGLPANPCVNIDWYKEQRRDAAIKKEDLPIWYKEVLELPNPIRRDFLLLTLFTGLRRTSATEIRWEHVDLDKATLDIPNPKGGEERAFILPLSDVLVELLERRKIENEDFFPGSPWVFPAESKSGHISEPKEELSIQWTIHGLRNTFITVAESLDVSPYAIKLLTNHALPNSDVTAGYIQIDTDRLRVPMQMITDKLIELCHPTQNEGRVVKLRGQIEK